MAVGPLSTPRLIDVRLELLPELYQQQEELILGEMTGASVHWKYIIP